MAWASPFFRQGSRHLPCATSAARLQIPDTQGYKQPLVSTGSLPQKSRTFNSHEPLLATIPPFLHDTRLIVPLQISAHPKFLFTDGQILRAFGKASETTGKPSLLQPKKTSSLSLAHKGSSLHPSVHPQSHPLQKGHTSRGPRSPEQDTPLQPRALAMPKHNTISFMGDTPLFPPAASSARAWISKAHPCSDGHSHRSKQDSKSKGQ